MTHDDITNRLRDPRPIMSIDAQTTMLDAADRLDLYREALSSLISTVENNWLDEIEDPDLWALFDWYRKALDGVRIPGDRSEATR